MAKNSFVAEVTFHDLKGDSYLVETCPNSTIKSLYQCVQCWRQKAPNKYVGYVLSQS